MEIWINLIYNTLDIVDAFAGFIVNLFFRKPNNNPTKMCKMIISELISTTNVMNRRFVIATVRFIYFNINSNTIFVGLFDYSDIRFVWMTSFSKLNRNITKNRVIGLVIKGFSDFIFKIFLYNIIL